MKSHRSCLFRFVLPLSLAFTALLPARAQSLQDVVHAHVQAVGGEEALRGLKTLQMEASVKYLLALGLTLRTVTVDGTGVARSLSLGGMQYQNIVTAQGGYKIDNDSKRKSMAPQEAAVQFDAADLEGPFVDTQKKGVTLQLLGEKTLKGGIKTHVVEASRPGREPVRYFIRSDNHLLARMETKNFHTEKSRWEDQVMDYDDHRSVAGLQLPFRIRLGSEYTVTVNSYKINEPVDPAVFH